MLNIAIIGLGWWGRIITGQLKGNAHLRPVVLADVNTEAGAAFAAGQGIAFEADYARILARPDVQAVVLCTPHSQHCEQVVAAAAAGKHVFCEKPLSMSRKDVLLAVGAVQQHGVVLAVGHERRFEPPIQEAMRLLHSGVLGTPLQVEANFSQDKFLALASDNWRLSGKEAPAGPMTATGIHLLDLSVGVFGEAAQVYTSVKQLGSPLTNGDTLAAMVTFKRGGHALISAILATPFAGRFAIYGSQGWVEVVDRVHPEASEGWVVNVCIRGENGGRPVRSEWPAASGVLANLEAFATAATGGAPYPVPQEQMVANISALEAVFKSAASGRIELVEG
ncbi:MAG: Gfo/Idh/MocA family oxidoreductase [Pseudomonadota bacterium]